jgi:hypothetical protein
VLKAAAHDIDREPYKQLCAALPPFCGSFKRASEVVSVPKYVHPRKRANQDELALPDADYEDVTFERHASSL